MQHIFNLLPMISCIFFLCVTYLPYSFAGIIIYPPDLTLMGIYYWSSYRPGAMPYIAVIGLGYTTDIVTSSTFGTHALAYLVVSIALRYSIEQKLVKTVFLWKVLGVGTTIVVYTVLLLVARKDNYNAQYYVSLLLTMGIFPALVYILDKMRHMVYDT